MEYRAKAAEVAAVIRGKERKIPGWVAEILLHEAGKVREEEGTIYADSNALRGADFEQVGKDTEEVEKPCEKPKKRSSKKQG